MNGEYDVSPMSFSLYKADRESVYCPLLLCSCGERADPMVMFQRADGSFHSGYQSYPQVCSLVISGAFLALLRSEGSRAERTSD